jgi:threonine dehydrogenase-like Zn-dependent dehydrogenase
MKALVWHGTKDVRVEEVPDPKIEQPTDAIVRITSTAICGSDLHLYDVLGPFLDQGDILGHEPMGVVEEAGPEAAAHVRPGDRVVIPFNISCGHCWMCGRGLYAQCETTQVREQGKVAYADTPKDGTLAVLGLGPIGQFSARIARHLGIERVIGVDPVPERRAAAAPSRSAASTAARSTPCR